MKKMEKTNGIRPTIMVTVTLMNATLYAVLSFLTAYIPSPWGVGQFRPAVIIPAFFATIFGPMSGGVGAAMGTLIADSLKHGQIYAGSLLAAVPGNFIGFYIFGMIVKKKFSWGRFILASEITLTVANAIVAFLYVFLFKIFYLGDQKYVGMSLDISIFFSIGLTIWWFVTMLPFILFITPILIRLVASAFPSIVPYNIRSRSLENKFTKMKFCLAILVPGLIMLTIGLATSFTYLGTYINSFFGSTTFNLIQLMFYISGSFFSVLGLVFYSKKIL